MGDPLTVTFNGGEAQSVTVVSAILAASVAGGLGWALLAILGAVSNKARRVWTALASVVLLLSLAGPLGADADTATTSALVAMHLVVGLILIVGLHRTTVRD